MEKEIEKSTNETSSQVIPLLPLRDVVVYPYMVIPLFVGREKSIKALEAATDENKQILLVAQKDSTEDNPEAESLYQTGTLANILQLLKLPDGTVKVLVEGVSRATITRFKNDGEFIEAEVATISDDEPDDQEADVLMRTLVSQFEQYVKLNKKIPPEVIASLSGIDEIARLADTVAAHMVLKLEDKQKLLEMPDVKERIEKLMSFLESEIDIQQIEKRIRGRVKK
jgi:ATP-dependent Lon protease